VEIASEANALSGLGLELGLGLGSELGLELGLCLGLGLGCYYRWRSHPKLRHC
jgi:hypothetical protein